MELKIGDVVELLSGGQRMTIIAGPGDFGIVTVAFTTEYGYFIFRLPCSCLKKCV